MIFQIALKFSDCDEPFLRKLSESGKIIGRDVNNQIGMYMSAKMLGNSI